ncbi:AraC-like transcription regulator (plasmid) [Azospirillum sp. B510]|uniref:AraC family transcriptional regulator n=1 Tax=Azospirillum sp. (strain B510) TaxID=137722 RepID=UPI0001C4C806|nr:AraC family transcriptional regulator [Azospirillum sp. B510]BAI76106.1 AraC-like transcription regulator [Azospirillum sp. B510]
MASPHRPTVSARSYDGHERRHAHDHHQIVLPVTGTLDMEVGGARGRVGDGQGVLVADGVPHSFRSGGTNRFVVLDVPAAGLVPEAVVRACDAFFAIDGALDGLVCYLAAEAADRPLDPVLAHHAAGLLLRALETRRSAEPAPPVLPLPADPIDRALALMAERCGEALTVAELAEAAGLAPSRFHERFRVRTGSTPARLLAELRLDRAEALLRDGRLPLAEVALAVGFSDQTALTRSLRRRRGTTPGALRKAVR